MIMIRRLVTAAMILAYAQRSANPHQPRLVFRAKSPRL
jgi:hypothetical protein